MSGPQNKVVGAERGQIPAEITSAIKILRFDNNIHRRQNAISDLIDFAESHPKWIQFIAIELKAALRNDPEPYVRKHIITGIESLPNDLAKTFIPNIKRVLNQDPDISVKKRAIDWLSEILDRSESRILKDEAENKKQDELIRGAAIIALGKMGELKYLNQLKKRIEPKYAQLISVVIRENTPERIIR